jgi:putative DNA primase/helicase
MTHKPAVGTGGFGRDNASELIDHNPYSASAAPSSSPTYKAPPDADTTQSSLTTSALALAAKGLPVFPCNSENKPVTKHGFKDATRDAETIRAMFAKRGAVRIGIPTGRASGRVVIDIDPRHDGNVWLSENQNRLPPTLTHGTPRGGEHLAFRDPPDVEIRNSQGRIASGVDVRGTGGYVIVPPSKGYTIKHNGPLANMPHGLVTACLKPERPPPPGPRRPPLDHDGTPYGLKALTEECVAIHHAPFGQQEITLNNAALKIGSLVAANELEESYALSELLAAGNAMPSESGREPWRAAEIAKKVERALEDGKRTPRPVPPRPAESDAAASTFDAVLYTLQHDGEAALVRQSRSLAELSVRQLESLITGLKRQGVDETLLLTLAELLP